MSQRSVVARLAEEKGLVIVSPEALTLRRQRCGTGFAFLTKTGALVRDAGEITRLKALAVPPAYTDVRFAADASAHLQAVGTDAAGRLQYRYHPKWTEVREALKARRFASLARSLPDIERAVAKALHAETVDASFVLAAVVRLVSLTAIRAGGEAYAREHGTRGATTLLKSNVKTIDGARDAAVQGQGRQAGVEGSARCAPVRGVEALMLLPGRRLFQYQDAEGAVHTVRAGDVNAYLCGIAGRRISLKDFRTLVASSAPWRRWPRPSRPKRRQAPAPGARRRSRDCRGVCQHPDGLPDLLRPRRGDYGLRGGRAQAHQEVEIAGGAGRTFGAHRRQACRLMR